MKDQSRQCGSNLARYCSKNLVQQLCQQVWSMFRTFELIESPPFHPFPSLFQQAEETIGQKVIDDTAGLLGSLLILTGACLEDFHFTFSGVGQVSFVQAM